MAVVWGREERDKGARGSEPMFAIAAFAVIGQSYCLVLDDYAKLLFTPFPHRIHLFAMQADSYKCVTVLVVTALAPRRTGIYI